VLRLWFNRNYATTWHLIGMIRDNPARRPVHVLGSHTDPWSPMLAACDASLAEPDLDTDAYVEWALRTARAEAIDILVPRAHMAALSASRDRFAEAGTTLLCPDADVIDLFADKSRGYAAAAALGLPVPPYRVVQDAIGLRAAYGEFAALAEQVCMKPVSGVGGEGYRRLTAEPLRWDDDLAGEVRSLVRLDDVCRALDADGPRELLVMPFLDGAEVSVDVLADRDGHVHAAVARRHDTRTSRRLRAIVDDPEAQHIAETLVRAHRVAYLSNVQVKYWRGRAYLLELNTRAAGGVFQTALAAVNLPWAAICLAAGWDPGDVRPTVGATYVDVGSYVRLGEPAPDPHRGAGTARTGRPFCD
jgi:biotin carboxylase